jgi:hypothetical protein
MEYTYSIHNSFIGGQIIYRSDGSWIPTDEGNRDYQAYLAWVAEGNIAEEWSPQ